LTPSLFSFFLLVYRYGFGENQLYSTSTTFLSLRQHIVKQYRVGLPWISRGRWPVCLGPVPTLPHPTHVSHVLGLPISIPDSPATAATTTDKNTDKNTGGTTTRASSKKMKGGSNTTAENGSSKGSSSSISSEGEGVVVTEAAVDQMWVLYKTAITALFSKHKVVGVDRHLI
jgi:hypothetical protein